MSTAIGIKLAFTILFILGIYSTSFSQWITPPSAGYIPLFRLYKTTNGKHHLASTIEMQNLTSTLGGGWINEGLMVFLKESGTNPIYRFYSPSGDNHYFSTSSVIPAGYISEGMIGYGASGPIPVDAGKSVYRYLRIKGGSGHFYTTNYNELGGGNSTWSYEGIAFYLYYLSSY
ncbi:hypothetical protein GM921_14755 [Pedobacter sp. LMG 31464]|uniref:DUF5648 domain-containing protein n=1 Tax=Pedobacter planticolens TaxID=2679964 RepID=A0A923IW59_9SPHI|nr:hypothetical protein [Pedobacter planticolens]MBB2146761.1 hypothetical protein [Pedobacter planticolens]